MKKNIHDYIVDKKERTFMDIDFHDLLQLDDMGFNKEEISKELGVPKSYVNKLLDEYRRDF